MDASCAFGNQPFSMNSAVIRPHAMNAPILGITMPLRNLPKRDNVFFINSALLTTHMARVSERGGTLPERYGACRDPYGSVFPHSGKMTVEILTMRSTFAVCAAGCTSTDGSALGEPLSVRPGLRGHVFVSLSIFYILKQLAASHTFSAAGIRG